MEKKILHLCSNYVGTKIFPNLLYELNTQFGENYLFCPVKRMKKDKYSYLEEDNEVFKKNEAYAKVEGCSTKIDKLLFFPKRKKMLKAVKRNYDLSQFSSIMAHSVFTDGYVAKKIYDEYKIKYTVFVQNSDMNLFFKIPFLKNAGLKILCNAKKIIFCSDIVKKKFIETHIPLKYREDVNSKTVIIPFGVENIFMENRASARKSILKEKPIRIITVGTIDKNKNQLKVIEALKILRNEGLNVQLNLVGKIANEKYFKSLMKYDFVNYLGIIDYVGLIDIYRKNDIFVLVSKYETFGLVYAEAMTQALPLIYTCGQGFDGQFEDGKVGYAVESNDEKAIADKIKIILDNYEILSLNAIELSDKFNWRAIAKKFYVASLGI